MTSVARDKHGHRRPMTSNICPVKMNAKAFAQLAHQLEQRLSFNVLEITLDHGHESVNLYSAKKTTKA